MFASESVSPSHGLLVAEFFQSDSNGDVVTIKNPNSNHTGSYFELLELQDLVQIVTGY